MPEGPSLRRWFSMIYQFQGRKITRISGSSKSLDKLEWSGSWLSEVKVKGKQLYLHFEKDREDAGPSHAGDVGKSMWLKCHFLMWGSVRVNEFNCKPSKNNTYPEPRLVFYFGKEEFVVFYGGSFSQVEHPPGSDKDDIMSDNFDIPAAVERLLSDRPVCFTLLSQAAFSGLGNIIKNEVLFDTGVHPMLPGCRLSREKATEIVNCVVSFSKRWLEWKMEEKHSCKFSDWTKIYMKVKCPSDHCTIKSLFGPVGMERISYWCPKCQPQPEETTSATEGKHHDSITNPHDNQDACDEHDHDDEDGNKFSPSTGNDEGLAFESSTEKFHNSNGDVHPVGKPRHSPIDDSGCINTLGKAIKGEGASITVAGQSSCVLPSNLAVDACFGVCRGQQLSAHIKSRDQALASCPSAEGGDGDCRPFKKVKIEPNDCTSGLPSFCRTPYEAGSPDKDGVEGSRICLSLSDIRALTQRSIRVGVRRMNMTGYQT